MNKKLLFIIALPIVIASCLKSSDNNNTCGLVLSTNVAPASQIADVQNFLTASNITATQHPSGLFYKINQPGSGTVAGACSTVTVKYKGTLTNGTGFDSSYVLAPNGIPFTLGGLIAGWQIGIPLIKKGGSINLYIPPSLGYGSSASSDGKIPANSILVFYIDLVDVQ
jgi:FKBP-type peptidyl-prolyl cis-trans isomerase FkpA